MSSSTVRMLKRLGRSAMLRGVTEERWRRCPMCGGTTVRVYCLSYTMRYYYMSEVMPDFAWTDDLFPEEHFIMEALCDECDADVSHLVPGARLADEWTFRGLLRALEIVVGSHDNWRNCPDWNEALDVWSETMEVARAAIAEVTK